MLWLDLQPILSDAEVSTGGGDEAGPSFALLLTLLAVTQGSHLHQPLLCFLLFKAPNTCFVQNTAYRLFKNDLTEFVTLS